MIICEMVIEGVGLTEQLQAPLLSPMLVLLPVHSEVNIR